MKATFLIALLSLFVVFANSQIKELRSDKKCSDAEFQWSGENQEQVTAYSLDYCRTLKLDDTAHVCCYLHGKSDGKKYRGCHALTYSQYKNISDFQGTINKYSNLSDFSIHCNSKYLTIGASLTALVFALF